MNIQFSTNNVSEARKRLIKALGREAKEKSNLIELICEKVKEGKIRVGDPMMYDGQAPIYPTEKCTEQDANELQIVSNK